MASSSAGQSANLILDGLSLVYGLALPWTSGSPTPSIVIRPLATMVRQVSVRCFVRLASRIRPELMIFVFVGCWVVPAFKVEQIVTEYLYMWIAAFVMLILYVAMFVVLKGYATYEEGSLRLGRRQSGGETGSTRSPPDSYQDQGDDDSKSVAKMLLL
jgi:hypothetical protein